MGFFLYDRILSQADADLLFTLVDDLGMRERIHAMMKREDPLQTSGDNP